MHHRRFPIHSHTGLVVFLFLLGCQDTAPSPTVIREDGVDLPLRGSTAEQKRAFKDGDALFGKGNVGGVPGSGRARSFVHPRQLRILPPGRFTWSRRGEKDGLGIAGWRIPHSGLGQPSPREYGARTVSAAGNNTAFATDPRCSR